MFRAQHLFKFKSLDATRQQMEAQKATCTPQLDAVVRKIELKNQAMEAKLRESGFALRRRQIAE